MTTAVIGIGALGGTVARHLVDGGESVAVAARDPDKAAQFARELGGLSRAASVSEAIVDADAVLLAVMWQTATNLIPKYAQLLDGKVVIDPSNPIALDESGTPIQRDGGPLRNLPEWTSSGAVIAGLLPAGARYVKAFGTLAARDLASGAHRAPERVALLYATDDDRAGSVVERLISVAGFDPVKAGGVGDVGRIEMPGGDLHEYGRAFQGQPPTAAQAKAAAVPVG
jgi:predicted dinucleotide-binding enzyme